MIMTARNGLKTRGARGTCQILFLGPSSTAHHLLRRFPTPVHPLLPGQGHGSAAAPLRASHLQASLGDNRRAIISYPQEAQVPRFIPWSLIDVPRASPSSLLKAQTPAKLVALSSSCLYFSNLCPVSALSRALEEEPLCSWERQMAVSQGSAQD